MCSRPAAGSWEYTLATHATFDVSLAPCSLTYVAVSNAECAIIHVTATDLIQSDNLLSNWTGQRDALLQRVLFSLPPSCNCHSDVYINTRMITSLVLFADESACDGCPNCKVWIIVLTHMKHVHSIRSMLRCRCFRWSWRALPYELIVIRS